MKAFLSSLDWGRVLKWFVLPNIAFVVVAVLTEAPTLIGVLNLILISLSTAVCIAFAPAAITAFRRKTPMTDVTLIAIGIFLAWYAYVLRTTISLLWRYFPSMKWLIDSDINSYFLFVGICAACFHLLAPGSIDGRIPPRRWVKIGCIAAIAIFLALCLVYATDIQRSVAHGRMFLPYRPPLQRPQPL